jgi:hypothetical protein
MADMAKLAKLAKIFVAARDKKAALKKAFEAEEAKIDGIMDECKRIMLAENPADSGVKTLSTDNGTISYGLKTKASVSDWTELYKFIAANNRFDMLHKRVSDGVIEEYAIENGVPNPDDPDNPGKIPPPGVLLHSERTISIARPRGK